MSRRFFLAGAVFIIAILASACTQAPPVLAPATAPPTTFPTPTSAGSFKLVSNAFSDGGAIPKKYSCDGESTSPPLAWSGAPASAKSFALIMDDPDAPSSTFTHWVAFDIASARNEIVEGVQSAGKDGKNGRGQTGYTGPCPPSGTHRYFFTLYALDVASLGLSEGAARAEVERAMTGHILAKTQLMGRYSR
ncbi:MAG: YbhB/YbcL family Raf kinase inhibitor-like protein [Chloroflexota bacterium]|nr:YbhB/YbcL family Raf kinase inhibitor-like protein [Chloroflexota bacterium]